MWFSASVERGLGAARRAGLAVSKRMRHALGKIEETSGVGDDETAVGRHGSRAWMELIEETVEKIRRALFEKSSFVRLSRFEGFFRNLLGLPPKTSLAPPPPKPKPKGSPRSIPSPVDAEQAARLRAQIQRGRMQAQTGSFKAVHHEETKGVWPGPPEKTEDDDHS